MFIHVLILGHFLLMRNLLFLSTFNLQVIDTKFLPVIVY